MKLVYVLSLLFLVTGCTSTPEMPKTQTATHTFVPTVSATFAPSAVPSSTSTPEPTPQVISRYRIEFSVKGDELWIPIPQELDSQFDIVQINLTPEPSEYYVDSIYGNEIIFYKRAKGIVTGTYEFSSIFPTKYEIAVDNVGNYDTESDFYKLYTRQETWIETNDLEIINLAKSIIGDEANPYLAARKIYEYVKSSIANRSVEWTGNANTYRNEYGALATIHRGYGSCQNQALVFVTLSRAAGIPARVVHGINSVSLNQDRNLEDWSHSWAEFYLPNYGWIPADPSDEFGKISNLRIILSVGNNFPLGNSCPSPVWYCDNGIALFLNYPFGEYTFRVTKVK